ncbi:hypothetical protein [Uliginosibacterium gangwonense]|uniref:hypothetical protein n=1 Tax=Uliginosibacterium gangwonense TaxID=392736 RepID=UPI000381495D|nr:hypothetical protein [Uliginosibacterium gangwonense]
MRLYAKIEKTEKQNDGTLKVWGYASTETVDSDGEVVSALAIKAALPEYLKFGAVREMHQPIAAGTAIEAEVLADGRTWFGAHVVDPVAVKKVESGVYKGFSIGGKVTARDEINKNLITGLRLVEVSLVDRPANPEAVFTMFKADTQVAGKDSEPVNNEDDTQAELSSSTRKALKALMAACQSVQDALTELGCDREDIGQDENDIGAEGQDQEDPDVKEEVSGKSALIERQRVARIAKAAAIAVPRNADADDLLKASIAELMTLRKQHSDLLAKAESPRVALHGVAVGKSEDGIGLARGPRPVVKSDGVADEVATLVKAAQARPVSFG